ncbi:beta/alpha barrel domain-containing protein [Clostridium butyricum]|uniref:hypothetical protein n=1 Tax=Clostridium butyricum TaxID=1492 RepID=UPI00374F516F
MKKVIKVLDSTLRDGGQGLEDLNKNGIKTELFTKNDRKNIATNIQNSGIDIIELGCIEESDSNKEGFAIYQNIETVSKYIPKTRNSNQMFVGLYIGPDTDLNKIPEHNPELCDGIRVILRYSELQKSLDYCAALSKKGYKVFVQPMLTMRYSDDEIKFLIDSANEMGAFALYFVDSFGYMNEYDINRLFHFYDEKLDSKINIGFHPHNNMELAFKNVQCFLNQQSTRNVIIDSCTIGMGQGAGNMQTEVLINYLNENYGKNYDLNCVLEVCEIIKKFRPGEMETWGYSPVRFIPAIHKTAYKYAVAMRLQYNMSLVEINNILSDMPDYMRHRYTTENLTKLLESK